MTTWQEEYKRMIAEREAETERLQQQNAKLRQQLKQRGGILGAIDEIGEAMYGRYKTAAKLLQPEQMPEYKRRVQLAADMEAA